MQQSINTLIIVFAFAWLVESFTEYFFAKVARLEPYLHWIALGIGIAVCVLYRIDIFNMLFGITSPVLYVGEVITGVMISRGANYLNDFVTSFAKGNVPVVTKTTTTENATTTTTSVPTNITNNPPSNP